MGKGLRKFGIICAVLSFVICLVAGIWILVNVGFDTNDDAVWSGIGLYFVGKAFFVGPMLVIKTLRIEE